MPLSGGHLGPYEILELLGAGGMGEVYRARETRLRRDVALKVLPKSFGNDAERMARFSREAQILASLSHPNIAAIHGLEEAAGMRALVMELVDGPTLRERIDEGPRRHHDDIIQPLIKQRPSIRRPDRHDTPIGGNLPFPSRPWPTRTTPGPARRIRSCAPSPRKCTRFSPPMDAGSLIRRTSQAPWKCGYGRSPVTGNSFAAAKPRRWCDSPILFAGDVNDLDIAPYGKRAVVFPAPGSAASKGPVRLTFILNFPEAVKRKISAAKN